MEKLRYHHALLAAGATANALVDAAISACIKDVSLEMCGLSHTALPALGRLLQSPGFERLEVRNISRALFEGTARILRGAAQQHEPEDAEVDFR